MPELEDTVLSAIRRGEDSLPKLRAATGLDYAKLYPALHTLEFEWRSINSSETAGGFQRFTPASSEKSNEGPKGTLAPITPQAFKQTKTSVSARDVSLLQRDAPYCVTCRGLCLFDGMDIENRPHWRCKSCSLTFEGSSGQVVEMAHIDPYKEAEAKIASMVERGRAPQRHEPEQPEANPAKPDDNGHSVPQAPDPRRGPTYKLLDLAEVEEVMATEGTIAKGAAKLGLTDIQLYTRRQRDQAVEDAVQRGRARFYESTENETGELPVQSEQAKALSGKPQEMPQTITETITKETGPRAAYSISKDVPSTQKTPEKALVLPPTEESQDIIPEVIQENTQMATRTTELHGSLMLREEVQLRAEEIAQWPPERITEFFDAVSKVVNIPKRTFPTTIKRAWSKSFEDDNEEGMPALTMLYLISMLHEDMEEHEKQAVWCLVLYCKRVQAAAEAAREAKKDEQK